MGARISSLLQKWIRRTSSSQTHLLFTRQIEIIDRYRCRMQSQLRQNLHHRLCQRRLAAALWATHTHYLRSSRRPIDEVSEPQTNGEIVVVYTALSVWILNKKCV